MSHFEFNAPGEFQFPCELFLGRIPALHRDPLEAHADEVRQARADAAEWNKRFSRTTETKTKNTK